MVRKKKIKSAAEPGGFFSKKKKSRKPKSTVSFMAAMKTTLSIMFLTALVTGGAVGLIYLDRYVKDASSKQTPDGSLKLSNAPAWLNQDWIDILVKTAGGKRFPLDQDSARLVARKLEGLSWLSDIQVQTTPEFLEVRASYRQPIGMVQVNRSRKA